MKRTASGPMTSNPMTSSPMTSSHMTSDPMSPGSKGSGSSLAGAYLSLADYQRLMESRRGTRIVYFFHASWCPDCRTTDQALSRQGVPPGLTVVKVDFDNSSELRSMYGVTQQHTFVQVDVMGKKLSAWTGAKDGAAILAATRG